jgi:hypothetical protein
MIHVFQYDAKNTQKFQLEKFHSRKREETEPKLEKPAEMDVYI